jgi:hypothetical protein
MRVEVSCTVFQDAADVTATLQILRYFIDGRHSWLIDFACLEAVSRFARAQVPELAQSLEAFAQKAWVAETAYSTSDVAAAEMTERSLVVEKSSVTSAALELGLTGSLIVEDLVSDGIFIDFVVHVLSDTRLSEAFANGWVELTHAGGGGRIEHLAEQKRARFVCTPHRVAVLMDSDCMVPGQRTVAHDKAATLEAQGIPAKVLALREIENYIPNRALAVLSPKADYSRRIAALKTFDEAQRGHFDFKRGFSATSPAIPAVQADLYKSVPRSAIRILTGGFGKDVIKCLSQARAALTPADLQATGADIERELRDLAAAIRALI